MGDAKRRKQKLGQAYGHKQPPLNSPRLKDVHLEKFVKDSTIALDRILDETFKDVEQESIQDYLDNTQEKLTQQLQAWLDNYLSGYEPQDREFLASTHMVLLLDLFGEATDSQKENMIFPLAVACRAYQPYLDTEVSRVTAEFQASFNDLFDMLLEEETATPKAWIRCGQSLAMSDADAIKSRIQQSFLHVAIH